jgi:hypothetical protein
MVLWVPRTASRPLISAFAASRRRSPGLQAAQQDRRGEQFRFLIRDRDSKFTAAFDIGTVLCSVQLAVRLTLRIADVLTRASVGVVGARSADQLVVPRATDQEVAVRVAVQHGGQGCLVVEHVDTPRPLALMLCTPRQWTTLVSIWMHPGPAVIVVLLSSRTSTRLPTGSNRRLLGLPRLWLTHFECMGQAA